MSTLSLAVILLAGHCALAHESRVLHRLANAINQSNDNATTHRRLTGERGNYAVTKEYKANFEVTCQNLSFQSPILGKYTITSPEEFANKRTGATIVKKVGLYKSSGSNRGSLDWVILDKFGFMHFWAPVSENDRTLPPKTGWKHVEYNENGTKFKPTVTTDSDECKIVYDENEGEIITHAELKCKKIWKKHAECEASFKALDQLPECYATRQQNKLEEKLLVLKGTVECPDCDGWGEVESSSRECPKCDGTGKTTNPPEPYSESSDSSSSSEATGLWSRLWS